jgi:hypothetical protein
VRESIYQLAQGRNACVECVCRSKWTSAGGAGDVRNLEKGEDRPKGRKREREIGGENQNNKVSFWTTGSKRVNRVLIMML